MAAKVGKSDDSTYMLGRETHRDLQRGCVCVEREVTVALEHLSYLQQTSEEWWGVFIRAGGRWGSAWGTLNCKGRLDSQRGVSCRQTGGWNSGERTGRGRTAGSYFSDTQKLVLLTSLYSEGGSMTGYV